MSYNLALLFPSAPAHGWSTGQQPALCEDTEQAGCSLICLYP